MENIKYRVRVSCLSYNHASYIEEAMNGFCMQVTSFPFVCTIMDDCSTDGAQEVIMNYLKLHFNLDDPIVSHYEETEDYTLVFAQHKTNRNCFFVVLFLKYNHYRIKKPKMSYIKEWCDTPYVAICEGDDYWIDPQKLEKQIVFLDKHPNFTMVCNRTKLYSEKKKNFIGENYCYDKTQVVDPKDVIRRTGLFISTCSIVFRSQIQNNCPDYCQKCKVGDYPLQILCAMKGGIFYFDDIMSVYRVENASSWMGNQQWGKATLARMEVIKSQVRMFEGFGIDYPRYKKVFRNKIADHINRNIPYRSTSKEELRNYLEFFSEEIGSYSFKWKIDLMVRQLRAPVLRKYYTYFFLGKYKQRKMLYS